MTVAALTPLVREALGVSSDYDAVTIPALIRRSIKRLLRDYHFPKSVVRTEFAAIALATQNFELPAGFKKELGVQFYDPVNVAWSNPLRKSTGFRRPYPQGHPFYYWLEGTKLWLDTPIPLGMENWTLQLFAENWLAATHEGWMTEDFEDVIFYHAVVRGAAEMRKPDVMQAFGPLWADEQQSIAIYANELEFGNVEMLMREAPGYPPERYPVS